MKRYAYSSILLAVLLLSGCHKQPEIDFAGTVIGIRQCSGSYPDMSAGYIVQLDYPDSIGGTISTDEGTMKNLIVLYEPNRIIQVDNHIHGTFYRDDKYSKANCSLRYTDYELPEGVFIDVKTEKLKVK